MPVFVKASSRAKAYYRKKGSITGRLQKAFHKTNRSIEKAKLSMRHGYLTSGAKRVAQLEGRKQLLIRIDRSQYRNELIKTSAKLKSY